MNQDELDDGAGRRLVAAVLLQAVRDAQRGSGSALTWLMTDGAAIADDMRICDRDVVRSWGAVLKPRKGTVERLHDLLVERPGISAKEAARFLGVKDTSVEAYRNDLRSRGDL